MNRNPSPMEYFIIGLIAVLLVIGIPVIISYWVIAAFELDKSSQIFMIPGVLILWLMVLGPVVSRININKRRRE